MECGRGRKRSGCMGPKFKKYPPPPPPAMQQITHFSTSAILKLPSASFRAPSLLGASSPAPPPRPPFLPAAKKEGGKNKGSTLQAGFYRATCPRIYSSPQLLSCSRCTP